MREPADVALSEGVLRTILERIPIRVFWKDRDCRYVGCNTLFAKDAGVSGPGEVIGRTDFDLCWAAQAEIYRADDRRVMESGVPKLAYVEPQSVVGGGSAWLRTSKVPLRDAADVVVGVLGIYEDITDEQSAQASLHLTQFASDHAPEGVCWLDERARFTYVNTSFCRIVGYVEAELLRMALPDDHGGSLARAVAGHRAEGPAFV